MSVDFQRAVWRCIPEDRSLHNHRYESPKSCSILIGFVRLSQWKHTLVDLCNRDTLCFLWDSDFLTLFREGFSSTYSFLQNISLCWMLTPYFKSQNSWNKLCGMFSLMRNVRHKLLSSRRCKIIRTDEAVQWGKFVPLLERNLFFLALWHLSTVMKSPQPSNGGGLYKQGIISREQGTGITKT